MIENNFEIPKLQTDIMGGKRINNPNPLPKWRSGEDAVADMEHKLDISPGSIDNKPAYTRNDKRNRLNEVGEV